MKRLIVMAALAAGILTASPVLAQSYDCASLDVRNMNATDLAHAQALCANKVQAAAQEASKEITPDKVKEWASIGRDFSQAIVATAQGLGQTANQFLFTPLGILIAFYFLWGKIGGILIGVPLLIGVWTLCITLCNRFAKCDVEYVQVPILWGAWSINKVKTIDYGDQASNVGIWFGGIIISVVLSAIILGCLIF